MRAVGLTLVLLVACGRACEFLEGAEDHISIQFKTNRLGHIRKLTDLEFRVQPMDAIVTKECRDQLVVVRQAEGGEYNGEVGWERVDRAFKLRSRNKDPYYQWEVAGIVPCRSHTVRLYLGENFIETSMDAATTEQMADFQFNPGAVSNIHMEGDELVWTGSECATGFSVTVTDAEGEVVIDEEKTTSRRLSLSSLDACTGYDFEIAPMIDEFMAEDDLELVEINNTSESGSHAQVFQDELTAPSAAVLSSLALDVQANDDQVTISWSVPKEIACVYQFEVSVCDVRAGNCQKDFVDAQEGAATATFDGLSLSAQFEVTVFSKQNGRDFGSTSASFYTKVDLDVVAFTASEDEDGSSVKLSWSDVEIATQFVVYRRQAGGEEERLASFTREELEREGDLLSFHDTEVERCQQMQYGLVLVVDGQEYSMLESETIILPLDETEPYNTPIDVEVEATSVSVSFTGSPCIPAYSFSLCDQDGEQCFSQESEQPAATFSDLVPCSSYTLEVTPLMGEERREWSTAVHEEFVTKEELRAPPQESLTVGDWNSLTGQLHVSWDSTSCADAFEVRLLGEDGVEKTHRTSGAHENLLMLGSGGEMEVRGCTNYSLEVFTISQGGEVSVGSASSLLTFGPVKDSLMGEGVIDLLEIGSRNLSVAVYLTEDTGCMEEVRALLCKDGADCEVEELEWAEEEDHPPALYLDKEHLAPGQKYELVLSFIHNGEEVAELRESFTTSLDLSQLKPEAVAVEDKVVLTWAEVDGADNYLVHRQYEGEDPEEDLVTNVSESEAAGLDVLDQRLCSTATYLVEVVKEGLDEQPRISSNPVTVLPNNTEPFMAEDLQVHTEGREDVGVEWRHLPCVEGYTVTFTSKDGREVTEEVSGIETDVASLSTKKLDECQEYDITIIPRFPDGNVWEAEPESQQSFRVKSEKECKEKEKEKQRTAKLSVKHLRRRSSAGHHQTSSIVLIASMLLFMGLRP